MSKCHQCRKNDAELLTTWERLRYWLFFRINHMFFPQDLEDLIADKYTQGYSDGNLDGYRQAMYKREYKIPELTYDKETEVA